MRFELFIAIRYLRAERRQAFIGIITGISIAGVAAGVASLVVAMAITNGFRQDLQQRLLGSTSHISLQRIADDGIKDWPAVMDRLSKQPHVVAAAPAIFEQVLISRGPRARGAVLKGMIPRYERRVGDLLNTVKQGSADELEDSAPTQPQSAPPEQVNAATPAASKPKSNAADRSVRSTQTRAYPETLALLGWTAEAAVPTRDLTGACCRCGGFGRPRLLAFLRFFRSRGRCGRRGR